MTKEQQALLEIQDLYIIGYRADEFDIYSNDGRLICPDFESEESAFSWLEEQMLNSKLERESCGLL